MAKPLYEIQPDGRWLFHLDNHMISSFTLCERYFEFSHIRNLTRKGGFAFKTSVGIWWSDVMADFYRSLLVGPNGKPAQEMLTESQLVVCGVEHWLRLKMDSFAKLAPDQHDKFGGSFVSMQIRPDVPPVPVPLGAINMVTAFYKHRAGSDNAHWKVIAVEAPFGTDENIIVGSDDKVIVAYEGRPDIVIQDAQGRLMPVDNKTKDHIDIGRLTTEYKPHPQTAGYVFVANLIAAKLGYNVNVDRCMMLVAGRFPSATPRDKSKSPAPRFVQIPVNYSTAELEEWRSQLVRKASRLRYAIEHDDWLIRESSCHYQYGHPCQFLSVCSSPPNQRERLLSVDFEIAKPWHTEKAEERNASYVPNLSPVVR